MHPVSCFVNEAFKTNQPHCGVVNANKLCVFFSLLCQSIDSIGTDDCASESTIHGFDCNRMATDLWVANCKLQSLLCASFDAKKASSDVIWFDYSWIKRIMSHVCGHRAAAKCDSKKDQRPKKLIWERWKTRKKATKEQKNHHWQRQATLCVVVFVLFSLLFRAGFDINEANSQWHRMWNWICICFLLLKMLNFLHSLWIDSLSSFFLLLLRLNVSYLVRFIHIIYINRIKLKIKLNMLDWLRSVCLLWMIYDLRWWLFCLLNRI